MEIVVGIILLGLGYIGYEHFYGDSATAAVVANPYAGTEVNALIDQTLSQPDVVAKFAVWSPDGAGASVKTPAELKTSLKAAYVGSDVASDIEAAYELYMVAMNVDSTGQTGTAATGGTMDLVRRTDAKLSVPSQEMLTELSTRFGNRGLALLTSEADKDKVEAGLNESRRAVDEADYKGSSHADLKTLGGAG